MKYGLYSVRDEKVGFLPPLTDQSEQSAIRAFAFAINNPENIMNFSPKDFDLYKVGEFDSIKGVITPLDIPELVYSGTSAVGN